MTKKVAFYARYSTDLQNEVSIETQIEVGLTMIADRGWELVSTYEDRAISGTSYKLRPGIQALLRRVAQGDIDVVLCITVDRLSRDTEHSAAILKKLNFHSVELWTAHANARVTDMEMGLRAVLSHELIEQIRYRTREGMKTAVRKGKVPGGLSYGYRLLQSYDERGDRIPGKREIDEAEAEIIRWIFQEYALGKSPKELAVELNNRQPPVPGPRGMLWRDTAIRGHVSRGSGILNNEAYIGRIVWNRREYRKNPDTEKRVARFNKEEQWVVKDVPELRIVTDELWAAVKRRQKIVEKTFAHTSTNDLNRTHRPRYLLSGILECGHCLGPYAIMAKDRYGCTNRQKKLPIPHLGHIVCTSSKTIGRQELEERVLAAIPDNLLGADNVERINSSLAAAAERKQKISSAEPARLKAEIDANVTKQRVLGEQLAQRMLAGQMPLPILDQMLEDLEKQRLTLSEQLAAVPEASQPQPVHAGLTRLLLTPAIAELKAGLSNPQAKDISPWIDFMRRLFVKVVIAPSQDSKSADLTVHGHLAAIIAAQEAWREASKELQAKHAAEFVAKRKAGQLKTLDQKVAYLNRCQSILAEKEVEWMGLQVSVVAGAGFEPAAFRL